MAQCYRSAVAFANSLVAYSAMSATSCESSNNNSIYDVKAVAKTYRIIKKLQPYILHGRDAKVAFLPVCSAQPYGFLSLA